MEAEVKETISEAVRELLCQRCNQEYPVWFAPNDLWNQVQRAGEHFFCLTCFAVLAEERGVKTTAWKVTLESDEGLAEQAKISSLTAALAAEKARVEALEKRDRELQTIEWTLSGRPIFDDCKAAQEKIELMLRICAHADKIVAGFAQTALAAKEVGNE